MALAVLAIWAGFWGLDWGRGDFGNYAAAAAAGCTSLACAYGWYNARLHGPVSILAAVVGTSVAIPVAVGVLVQDDPLTLIFGIGAMFRRRRVVVIGLTQKPDTPAEDRRGAFAGYTLPTWGSWGAGIVFTSASVGTREHPQLEAPLMMVTNQVASVAIMAVALLVAVRRRPAHRPRRPGRLLGHNRNDVALLAAGRRVRRRRDNLPGGRLGLHRSRRGFGHGRARLGGHRPAGVVRH